MRLETRARWAALWLCLAGASAAAMAAEVCGDVCDQTWSIAGSPYLVSCDVTVPVGCVLDIQEGVDVRFAAGTGLMVDGDLNVTGVSGNPARFLSDAAAPTRGDWSGLVFRPGSTGALAGVDVRYAGRGVTTTDADVTIDGAVIQQCSIAAVEAGGGTLGVTGAEVSHANTFGIFLSDQVAFVLDDVRAHDTVIGVFLDRAATGTITGLDATANLYGLYVQASTLGATSVTAEASRFVGNSFGVWADGNDDPGFVNPVVVVTSSSIHDNAKADYVALDFHDRAATVLAAGGNWWGTTDPVAIAARVTDYSDLSSRSPKVDWCRFLDGPPPAGVPAHASHCPDLYVCDGSAAWAETDEPYLLTSTVTVCPTGELSIGPGVTVEATSFAAIEAEGQLNILGTPAAPVLLTSRAAAPATFDWEGLSYLPGATGTVSWAEIAYATVGVRGASATIDIEHTRIRESVAGIYAEGGSLNVTETTTESEFAPSYSHGLELSGGVAFALDRVETSGSGVGLWIDGAASGTLTDVGVRDHDTGVLVDAGLGSPTVVEITGATFDGNTTALFVRGDDDPGWVDPVVTVTASAFTDNSEWHYYAAGFQNPAGTVLPAGLNWWGTTDPAAIGAKIRDGFSTSPTIDWCSYLDAPPPAGVLAHRSHCPDLQICDESATWSLTDRPYLITSDLRICATGSLDLGAGVTLRVVPGQRSVRVEGAFSVAGTDAWPAVLTSHAVPPAPGDWQGVEYLDGSTGNLSHLEIAYALRGVEARSADVSIADSIISDCLYAGVDVRGGTLTVDRTRLLNNIETGLRVTDQAGFALTAIEASGSQVGVNVNGAANGTLINSALNSNTNGLVVLPAAAGVTTVRTSGAVLSDNGIGVYVQGGGTQFVDPEVVLSASSLHGNADFALAAFGFADPAGATVWAPDCFWGTTDPAEIAALVYDRDDSSQSPRVVTRAFGTDCEVALGRDADRDGLGDFEDNCPSAADPTQADADGDGMGDACDPAPAAAPTGACDGSNDAADGFADADGDGWGDPCDHQPLRADSYPGAPERCDGRDNDGDAAFGFEELIDADGDLAVACGDCDEADPSVFPCACEACGNAIDDDCDGASDLADAACAENPYCVLVTPGSDPPELFLDRGACGGGIVSGPHDVIRGLTANLSAGADSVDLGAVTCVAASLAGDRVTDVTLDADARCNDGTLYWLARPTGTADFGQGTGGLPRSMFAPDPPCP